MKIIKIVVLILILGLIYILIKVPIRRAYYDYKYNAEIKDKIKWEKDLSLKWTDFRYSETKTPYTQVGFGNRYEFNIDWDIDYKSVTLFYPLDSYIDDTTSVDNLEMQQYRFDLCEIYRRKLETKIRSMNYKDFPSSSADSVDINSGLYYDQFEQEWDRIVNLPTNERLIKFRSIKDELNK